MTQPYEPPRVEDIGTVVDILKDLGELEKQLLRLAEFANVAHSIKEDTTPEEIATWIEQSVSKTIAGRHETINELTRQVDHLQADNTRLLEERRAVDEHYMVEHFHRIMPQPVLSEPQVPEEERVRLRLRLDAEEFFELVDACVDARRFYVFDRNLNEIKEAFLKKLERCAIDVDMAEFADACADLKYVIVGSELEFGIDGRPIFRGVHEANLKKLGGGKRADGKFLKPEGWQPFDVAAELRRQGWRGP